MYPLSLSTDNAHKPGKQTSDMSIHVHVHVGTMYNNSVVSLPTLAVFVGWKKASYEKQSIQLDRKRPRD